MRFILNCEMSSFALGSKKGIISVQGEISVFLDYIERACILISPQEEYNAPFLFSPDAKDTKVFQCAVAGYTDYLVTGDKKDLLLINDQTQLGNT